MSNLINNKKTILNRLQRMSILLIILSSCIMHSQTYCDTTTSVPVLTTNVTFSNINNPSNSIDAITYEDFTDVIGNVTKSETYTLSAQTNGFLGITDMFYLQVYIDWNQNGIFEENEFYVTTTSGTFTKDIIIPESSLTGETRMRIVIKDSSNFDPCSSSGMGQIEDYTLNISNANSEMDSILITTQNNTPNEITTENGTLQLMATVNPEGANQEVTWSIAEGAEFATIDQNGLVSATANGTITVRATSIEDESKFGELNITITSQEEDNYCVPEFFYPSSQAAITLNKISLAGETITWDVDPVLYNDNGYANYTHLQSADLISGNDYELNFSSDWQDPHFINVRAWIDYNQNNEFDDNEEIGYYSSGIDPSGNGTFVFTVPENTPTGTYRLRTILQFPNSTPNNLTPCGTINSYGIAIDYNIQITQEDSSQNDYCDVTVEYDVEPITFVEFSNINNPSSPIVNGSPAYEDFTSLIANVNKEQSYTLTVKGNTNGNFEHDIRVFIDWNQDYTFDMNTEFYTASLSASSGEDNIEVTFEIPIPTDAVLGNTRMRIIKDQWNIYEEGEFDACTDAYYGQVEDYTVNILEANAEIVITSVEISTENNIPANIETVNGTLQLIASVTPNEANQAVTWSIMEGEGLATINANGLVTAIANGTVTVRATSVEDETKFDEIEVTINFTSTIIVESVEISVENDLEPEITIENGTLQLIATVNPNEANQAVTWSIIEGEELATINANGLVTAIANGTITVRATSVEDETKLDEVDILIDTDLSTAKIEMSKVKIYPNPTSEIVNIQSEANIKEIIIFDSIGKKIMKTSHTDINISSLPSGIYFFTIEFENNTFTSQKVIKK